LSIFKKIFQSALNNNLELKLAKHLQRLREEKGLSQESLGLQLQKGQSDIAKIENGKKRITYRTIALD